MLNVDEFGVVALEENALTAIGGGDGGCEQLAYALGYAIGWVAGKVGEVYTEIEPFTIVMAL